VELSFARNCESRERLRLFIQFHLPESGSKIQGQEELGICSSDVTNAFGDFLHGIFVDLGALSFEIFLSFCIPNVALNDWLFIQVIAAPVLNNHDVVWFPVLTLILGQIFSPSAKISYSLLQVVNEARHRLSINCGSTALLPLNGVM
jgi:hypothetical protein